MAGANLSGRFRELDDEAPIHKPSASAYAMLDAMPQQSLRPTGPGIPEDGELAAIEYWWATQERASERIGEVIRRAFDQVLDGQDTGRYLFEDLATTEKAYIGTKVEILLRNEFGLGHGSGARPMDYRIVGIDVDCKFSLTRGWMIPREAVGQICLLVTASDVSAQYSFGLVRCWDAYLTKGSNQDKKRGISKSGKRQIRWLWQAEPLPENLLRNLSEETLKRIFRHSGTREGQVRVNELLRNVHDKIIRREVTLTVARQPGDPMKRARDARHQLQPEGIVVLGHQAKHPAYARDLDLPVPKKGEFVATRVVRATEMHMRYQRPFTTIDGTTWSKATQDDPVEPGPLGY